MFKQDLIQSFILCGDLKDCIAVSSFNFSNPTTRKIMNCLLNCRLQTWHIKNTDIHSVIFEIYANEKQKHGYKEQIFFDYCHFTVSLSLEVKIEIIKKHTEKKITTSKLAKEYNFF
ncbi:hypothetical protein BpHYR1_017000 [Brachionus plicatilis]|uniref:Uncharacterized protein n=1 Tax=Brachionus plicatilis TaxID=10195 RepID=A0A3M7R9M8_BRAPC|nr:hypothetical protein BpHYR1_017000 [Brachionus plicatilis]